MAGAAIYSLTSALRTGAGLVSALVPQLIVPIVQTAQPSAMCLPMPCDEYGQLSLLSRTEISNIIGRFDVLAMGPGLGRSTTVPVLLESILQVTPAPLVLDADALFALAALPHWQCKQPVILTPHYGEMARLLSVPTHEVATNPVKVATQYAKAHNAIVVLKGATTVIAHPDGRVTYNTTGSPALAKGGSGDILTGIITALLAQRVVPYNAARLGSYLLGMAGEIAAQQHGNTYSVLPQDVLNAIPNAIQAIVE